MKVSDAFGGIGSLATSAVPVLEKMNDTCGKRLTVLSTDNCIDCDCDSDVLGILSACMAMFFSSSEGMNSWPRRKNPTRAAANSTTATAMTGTGLATARCSSGLYQRFKAATSQFSFSCTRPVMQIAISAGTSVSDSTKAAASARITVSAIGSNILPSTPVKVRSGT